MRRDSWLSRNVDLLAVACVLVFGAVANIASGVIQSRVWQMRLDSRHIDELRPAILEIRHDAMELRDEIRGAMRPRIE
jgi:hypothetical protein